MKKFNISLKHFLLSTFDKSFFEPVMISGDTLNELVVDFINQISGKYIPQEPMLNALRNFLNTQIMQSQIDFAVYLYISKYIDNEHIDDFLH